MRKAKRLCIFTAAWLLMAGLSGAPVYADLDLTVRGVDDPTANNIEMHLASWESLPGETIGVIEEAINRDVVRALQAMGYYRAEINYRLDDGTLVLEIDPGQPVTWGNADIQVLHQEQFVEDFRAIVDNHPFTRGEPLRHQAYENYKRRLLNTANDLGYLDAQMQTSQLRVDVDAGAANIVLLMQAGRRYRLGDIDINNSDISSRTVDIIIEEQAGEWFSAGLIGDVYNRLLESGYFTRVNIRLDKQPPDVANLDIEVVESPEHRVSTGVGYGTDTGARLQLKWQRPHTNDRGNSWNSQLQISQVEQYVSSRYRIPYPHPQKRYFSWNTGYRRKQVEETITQVASTGMVFHLLRDSGWQYNVGVNLEHERSQIGDEPESVQTYVIPSAHASKREIFGDPNNPRLAYKFWVNLAQSDKFLFSDTSFVSVNTGASTAFRLAQDHSMFLRLDSGAISADDFAGVPVSQRFFIGGDQSIRGYDFETVSPLDQDGNPIGGQYFSAATVEYRYRWMQNWQAAIFADGGRSYVDGDEFCGACQDTGEDYRISYGLGLRWSLPLGSLGYIALDVAFPQTAVGNQEEPEDWKVHLYFGNAF